MLHESTKKFMEGFRYDGHPMGMFVSTVAALSTVYPDAKHVHDAANRMLQIKRLIGKVPSIAAMSYRHNVGFPYVYPDNDLSYAENFMNMLWKMVEPKYVANPAIARALDILFICTRITNRTAVPTPCAPSAAPRPIPTSPWRRRRRPWRDHCTAVPMKKC
jgi:citrate synthase